MAHSHGLNSLDTAGDLPSGSAPGFGSPLAAPFEHTPERLVLSLEEHSRLAPNPALSLLGGEFESERFGRGSLSVHETSEPGEVRIVADVFGAGAPVRMDARVRESWLLRAVDSEDGSRANALVVGQLFQLAAIPRQSTVKVHVQAD